MNLDEMQFVVINSHCILFFSVLSVSLWLITMLSVEEALEAGCRACSPLPPRRLPLAEAAGLLLAEDITSEINSPPYDKAMMDGYAVRSADREPQRRVLEEIAAGDVPRFPLTPGTASRIMTGRQFPRAPTPSCRSS